MITRLLLASASPRRRELLGALDLPVSNVALHDVDETYPADLAPSAVPEYIACLKRDAYDRDSLAPGEILVTADTIVILDGHVFGKPVDREDARRMLRLLGGHTHEVITGVALTSRERSVTFSTSTMVTFSDLSDADIDYYVDKYCPLDKAGSYGIQEWIGYVGIEKIDGCYYNVMGLPLHDLYRHLRSFR